MESSENVESSATTEDNETGGAGEQEPKKEFVPKDDHKRALDDLHKYKKEFRDAQSQLEDMRNQFKSLKESKASTNEDYKALYESTKQEVEDWSGKYKGLKESYLYSEKYREVYPKLKEAGLTDEAKKLLDREDLSDLEVETTSNGRVIITNTDEFVDKFKANYPFAFQVKRAPDVNTNIPGVVKGKVWTPDSLAKFEDECAAKGDLSPYYDAVRQYKKQKSHK